MLSQRHGGLTTHQPTPSTAPPPNARPPRPFASPAAAPRPVITSAAAIAAAAAPRPSRSPRHARNVATPSSSAAADLPHGGPPPARGLGASLDAAWKFVRPHTIRGTLLGTTALVVRALLDNPAAIDWALLPRAIAGLAALLCGNGYIVGINQIYDVDIDTVNKPFLPIAAGTMSPAAGWAYCAVFALLGTALAAFNFDRLIAGLYAFGLFLGTIYSVPPLRLKRFAVPAFLIIATVRGVLLNFGVFYATRAALGLPFAFEPAVAFITAFVTLFATSIAITKDLADVEGDIQCGIRTFATAWGVARVAALGSALLLVNYVAAVVLGVRYPGDFRAPVMIGGHAVLAAALLWRHHVLHKAEYTKAAVQGYYRAIWYLFYSEYLLFPFI